MRRLTGALFARCLTVASCTASLYKLQGVVSPLTYKARAFSSTDVLCQVTSPSMALPSSTEHDVVITDGKGDNVDVVPLNTFAEMRDAPNWLVEGLQSLQYPSTTDIQKFTIPLLADGHDVIGLAPTGSGKTVAFAVPALKNFRRNADGSPSVLVLAPTRELVQQTTKVFSGLSKGQVRICEAYGGAQREMQARHLHAGCDVLVACPGRLKDFLDAGDVSIKNLSFLVFDEADRLLDMGFQVQLEDILSYVDSSAHPQTMMWSATWPQSVQSLARNYLSDDRILIRAGTAGTGLQVNEHIKQSLFFCNGFRDRIEKLGELVESGTIDDNTDKLIIFVERQSDTENTAQAFSQRLGIDSRYIGTLHGGLSQRFRDRVMGQFKNNYVRLLIATDVASRGLDIPDVTCVVNFQAPKNIDSYCHRIGRTGRAGRSGKAYTFIGEQDGTIAGDLVDYLTRCKAEIPPELTQLADAYRQRYSSFRGRSSGRGRGRGSFDRRYDGHGDSGSRRGGSNRFDSRTSRSRPNASFTSDPLDW
ncbi:putative mitochondrial mitochondrial DEAD box protein [Leptomonas pyrrhocoris]|uniref:RNA helicase n=1 Tax=Leptomonas pyrrhocoris TaxID=157538 RepID=A0A0M9G918_LEPPY|nr:putative mitochondrial mitochondrial DEAD box protein [Leptomonas pyrrhocoris]KPA85223.1 putative mitochondrial mitochondrial DEAD box protein [Leptomonas pyrrhocoris]|eukprot:XP_015663662.1 putative mitochondrial mitochondrial DEAD box protein [Leptomonas pyrrhocoris]